MSVWSRRLAFDRASSRSFDADGRLHVSLAPITREQVATYLGREIPDAGRLGLDLGGTFQIWRPAAELMKAASSAAGLPITRRHVYSSAAAHPADDVIGSTMGDAIWDPPYVREKRLLLSTACAIFICGTACAREVTLSPTSTPHGSTISAARHVAQSNNALGTTGEFCTTEYISTRDDKGSYVRKSVDCED